MAQTPGSDTRIHPVILSGGSGTRLWPLSRALYPKQLLPLYSDSSMLIDTAARVQGPRFGAPLIICNREHRFIVAEQCRDAGIAPQAVVLEPLGRNTAPAVAVAALMLTETDPDAVMMVLPSDHVIRNSEAFLKAVDQSLTAALSGALVTFGIHPETPETGYGYIRRGTSWDGADNCYRVEAFVEKPDLETARKYLADGGYAWNSGMFLFQASRYLAELERLRPDMVAACRDAVAEGSRDLDFFRLDEAAFARCESDSIDYAVMERTADAAVVPVDMGWSDVGSWSALWDIAEKDGGGNVTKGDVILADVADSYVRSEDSLVAVLGLKDVVVVVTPDAVLVSDKAHAQEVRTVVDNLKEADRTEHLSHRVNYRPWGNFQTVDSGPGFKVNHLMVKPGGRMRLQSHRQRAEHWVIVAGTARVTRDDQHLTLSENQSIYFPIGTRHRLENQGNEPLRVIEVQSGSYLGEDDVVRHDDDLG